MAVYTVLATMPNGTGLSMPVIANSPEEAQDYFAAINQIEEKDRPVWTITKHADPDGRYEAALAEAETRRLEAEFYKPSPARRRVRR